MSKSDEYVQIRVVKSWVRLIKFIAAVMPDGEMTIKFVNGEPVKPMAMPSPDIRFDKEVRLPQYFAYEFANLANDDNTEVHATTAEKQVRA